MENGETCAACGGADGQGQKSNARHLFTSLQFLNAILTQPAGAVNTKLTINNRLCYAFPLKADTPITHLDDTRLLPG